jgi:hypothetical protein
MLFVDGGLGLLVFALWVFCLIDVIVTDDALCRNLQKGWWLLIVLLLFDVGAVLWLVAGRPWQQRGPARPAREADATYPEYDRPGRFAAADPAKDEEFLKQVRDRAEEQRRQYREQQQRAQDEES